MVSRVQSSPDSSSAALDLRTVLGCAYVQVPLTEEAHQKQQQEHQAVEHN